uniref:Transposase n=1 Tax=Peronospora matthiolae TaxID=2874970 RepID=A0AAV1UJZ7_9STRA
MTMTMMMIDDRNEGAKKEGRKTWLPDGEVASKKVARATVTISLATRLPLHMCTGLDDGDVEA